MKTMRRILLIALCLLVLLPFNLVATATSQNTVVGLNINNDKIGLFVTGSIDGDISCEISGMDCKMLSFAKLPEAQMGSRTLFLIDTSTSIQKEYQERIKSLLMQMIEHKPNQDTYAISTFGGGYTSQIDFTSERFDLAKIAESLEFNEEQTDVYQAIEMAIKDVKAEKPDAPVFSQVVIISDGVEYSDSGILKEELLLKIRDSICPVQAIGLEYKNNSESLKDLYAIARISGGESYTINSETNLEEIETSLFEYINSINWIELVLPAKSKDGAIRPLELFDSSGNAILTYEIRMPNVERDVEEEEPRTETDRDRDREAERDIEPVVPAKKSKFPLSKELMIIIGAALFAFAIIIVVVVLLVHKRKKKAPAPVPEQKPDDGTVFMNPNEDDATMLLIQNDYQKKPEQNTIYIVLNDILQPHNRYEIAVKDKIEIGREPTQPGITIQSDKRISKHHCLIVNLGGELWVRDLGSTNKTILNDTFVSEQKMLKNNDILTLGKTKFSVGIEFR